MHMGLLLANMENNMAQDPITGYRIELVKMGIGTDTIFLHKGCLTPQEAMVLIDTNFEARFETLLAFEKNDYPNAICDECKQKLFQ